MFAMTAGAPGVRHRKECQNLAFVAFLLIFMSKSHSGHLNSILS